MVAFLDAAIAVDLAVATMDMEWKGSSTLSVNMSSLVERLRVRSDRKPVYNIDDSDDDADFLPGKPGISEEKFERIVRSDAKENSCQACEEDGDLLSCETCTYAYHSKCLLRPLKAPFPDSWRCPECVSPLNDIEKILDCEIRPTAVGDGDASKPGSKQMFVKQYLVKWKGASYLHCTWVPEKEFLKAFKSNPRLKTKVNNFHRQMESANTSEEDSVAIRPEWTMVDRILASRGYGDEKEYLVKWKELSYDECYWESESDISAFQPEIERFTKFQSRSRRKKQKSSVKDGDEPKKHQKEFQQYEHSPGFLTGGTLHPYQLEGLNFLRFSWSKQTHVILADEMGLGKTIQSIAFLASLFEESVFPHLVVAPLSTLRNWEREFATWAPQMNVVMYVGSAQARTVIRDYEFYFPKKQKKIKKKKSSKKVAESKQDRIKFDVLLTSYEMINLDSASLKPIMWECMIVDEGHRLKNKDSKLFSSLKQYSTRHRVLLTGTPLQNNLDELFMLMHFLDAGKFGSLEEFQEEFKDINQEEQISRLHKMLAPHLLRRWLIRYSDLIVVLIMFQNLVPPFLNYEFSSNLVIVSCGVCNLCGETGVKKDVMKELPPKKELILRVELSSKQKEYYKAILTRNYQILTRRGGAQISLINVVMELRKLCCHPYMLEGVDPEIEDAKESYKYASVSYHFSECHGGCLSETQCALLHVVVHVVLYVLLSGMVNLLNQIGTYGAVMQLLESSGKLQLLDKMMVKLKEQGHRVLIYSQFQRMLDLLEDYCTSKKWLYERIDGKVAGAERQVRIDRFNAKNSSRFCFLLSTRAGGLGINLATADTVIIYDSDWNPHADLQAMARAHRLGQTNKVLIYRLITRGTIEERMMQMTKKKMVLEHLVVGRLKAQNINQEELDDIIRYGSKELFADENDEAGKSRQIHYDDASIDRLLDREQVGDEEAVVDDEDDDSFLKAFKWLLRSWSWSDLMMFHLACKIVILVANFEYIDEVEAAAEEARKKAIENNSTVNSSDRTNYWEELLRDKYEVHKIEEFNTLGKGKRNRKLMASVEEDDLAGLEDVSSDGEDDNYEADLTDGDSNSTGTTSSRRPYKKKARAAESTEPVPLMEGEGKSFKVLGFNQSQRAAFVQILMRFGVGDYDWKEFAARLKQKTYEEIKDYGALFLTHISEDISDSTTFSGDGVPKEGLRIPDVLVRMAVLMLIKEKVTFASENPESPLYSDDILMRYPGLKGGKIWKEEHDLVLLRAVLKHGYGRWQAIVDDKDLKIQEIICQELNLPIINLPVPGQVGSQVQNGANSASVEAPGNQSRDNGGNDMAADGAHASGDARNQAPAYQESSILYHFRDMQRRQVEFVKKRVLLLEKGLYAEYQKVYFADDDKEDEETNVEFKSEPKVTNVPSYKEPETDKQVIDQLPQVEEIGSEEISAAACDNDTNRLELPRLYNEMCKVVDESSLKSLAKGPAEGSLMKNAHSLETICNDISRLLSPTQQNDPASETEIVEPDNAANNGSKSMVMESGSDVEMGETKDDGVLDEPGIVVLDD
ncbi:CHD3-type chromatin-remodeling factor PICKLE isoform X1 [Senna tora]|uniref:CHD3-type chromatin-remodeling factor PICKLE isoform X1 n=1 Tax=Senna tora TaxID=362788 RepID=A0A834U411_9FABA|nr:CHD3-type chromatin-remodeling factor PICKLE isoform X1 [Senna tora]